MSEENINEPTENLNEHQTMRLSLRWYMFGLALLGGAVGYFAGTSQSPVIGTLIPLLFGLIGGVGGLYLAKLDFESSATYLRLKILGKALVFFILFTLFGSAYGISLRTQISIWSFVSPKIFLPAPDTVLQEVLVKDTKKAMEIILLRARIRALGASVEEERAILKGAAASMENKSYAFGDNAPLRKEIDRMISLLSTGEQKNGSNTPGGPSHQF